MPSVRKKISTTTLLAWRLEAEDNMSILIGRRDMVRNPYKIVTTEHVSDYYFREAKKQLQEGE